MTLFVFADQFKEKVVASVRIEVHSRTVIYTRTKLSNLSMHTLTLPTGPARSLYIVSNKPEQVFSHEGGYSPDLALRLERT